MAVVHDVSAILGQALDDEDATFAESVIAAIARDEAIVPTLFWYKIRNALVMAGRRKRTAPARTTAILSDLALLPFSVDNLPARSVRTRSCKEGISLFTPEATRRRTSCGASRPRYPAAAPSRTNLVRGA